MWLQWLYGVGGQLPEAEAAAARAAELDPGAKDTHLALGYIDYYGRGDLDGALGHFQAAEGIAADDAQVAGAIGNILRRQGRLDDAIVAYERRVEINPEHAQGLATLAGTYDAVGRHGDAWAIGDRLLELGDGRGYVRRFWASFHTADTARAWEQIPAIQEAQGRAGQPGYFAFLRAYARDDVGAADALIEEIGTEDTEAALAMLMAVHLGTTGQADAYANAFDAWITLNEDALVGGASTELDRTIQAVRHSDLALLEALRGNRDAAMAHIDAVEEIDLPSIDAWRSGPLIDVVLAQAAPRRDRLCPRRAPGPRRPWERALERVADVRALLRRLPRRPALPSARRPADRHRAARDVARPTGGKEGSTTSLRAPRLEWWERRFLSGYGPRRRRGSWRGHPHNPAPGPKS